MVKTQLRKAGQVFFGITWLLMLGCLVYGAIYMIRTYDPFGPRDVSRRVTAPDGTRTALLERDYGFLDLNFRLYVVAGAYSGDLPDSGEAIWMSRDYENTTEHNWHEDLEWSADSSVIAVSIEGQYVFAYSFDGEYELYTSEDIRSLLESHNDF